ncbi:unnamed protein product [Rotaria sp. Silwood2]|nr:unnamed protein product [Rotaria sp. Silwood2]
MYGLLLQSAIEIIRAKYGQETWEQIKATLRLDLNSVAAFQQYGETLFVRITKLLSEIRNEPISDLMNIFGTEFVSYISNYGYDRVLRILGHNMRDFLNGLDNLHEYMRYTYPRMRPPSFYVEKETAHGLTLHYRSRRRGFVHYVVGQITEVGRRFYDTNVQIDIVSEREEFDITHVVFELKFENTAYVQQATTDKDSNELDLAVDCYIFFELFPFHMVISESLEIVSAGDSLTQLFPNIVGELIRDIFNLVRPIITLNWSQIVLHSNNVFEFSTIEPLRKQSNESDLEINDARHQNDSEILLTMTVHRDIHEEYLRLRGQMLYVHEWKAIIYLATPVLENLDAMFNTGLFINDLSMHDSSRDLVLAGTQQSAELKLALDQEKQKSKALEDSMKKLDVEMKKTDLLLYQMIPKKIADRLRSGEKAANLCEALHIHITDATYQLLERKTYEVQERPKMTINGAITVTTYFILNKKDRSGKVISRPFQAILADMKRQDAEEAKLKQSSSLKGTTAQNSSQPIPKENGFIQSSQSKNDSNSLPTESNLVQIPTTINKDEDPTTHFMQRSLAKAKLGDEQSLKTAETISEQNNASKLFSRPQRSRACELL